MWVKHPRTGKPDTMLTAAIAGFVFVILFTAAALVAAWISSSTDFLRYIAAIDAAILTPTVAAYTARKYTDIRNGVSNKEQSNG